MAQKIKKLTDSQQPLLRFILSPKRVTFCLIAVIIFTVFAIVKVDKKVSAATGINRTINFQGKVVNSNGTNVADGQYTFVFKLYDAASGGANPWTETQNNVQVTGGVFRVSLGSVTSFASAGVDFNTDNLYLGINFNSDGEMTPRLRFAAVPYAINAETVGGLTVTSTTGTLTVPSAKTVQFGGAFTTSAQDLTLTLGGATNVTLPTTGTLATLGGTENLSNKTFTSTVTINGVTTDLTTGTNENLTLSPNGTGNVLIQTGAGGQAALVVDKTGLGDIFAASSSGVPKFAIKSDGNASSSAGFTVNGVGGIQSTQNQTLTLGGGSTGDLVIGRASQTVSLPGFDCSGSGNGGKLTTTSGGILTCAADGGGSGAAGTWVIDEANGVHSPINNTLDLLLGGATTESAKFAVLNIAGGTPTASLSAGATGGISINASGGISTTAKQTLAIGGDTNGNITFQAGTANQASMTIYQDDPNYAHVGIGTTSNIFAAPYVALQVDKGNILIRGQDNYQSAAAYLYLGDQGNYVNAASGQPLQIQGYHGIEFLGGSSATKYLKMSSVGYLGLGTQSPATQLHVSRDLSLPVSGQALAIFDQLENQDILAASASGVSKFVIKRDGTASSSAGFTIDAVGNIQSTLNQTLTVGGGTTGTLVLGQSGHGITLPGFSTCTALETTNGVLGCGTDDSGISSYQNFWQYNASTGIVANGNLTTDFLLGGTSTQSAKFAVLGVAGTQTPVASVSATSGTDIDKGIYLKGDGSLQSVRNNTLTIGGSTTGNIALLPNNGAGGLVTLSGDALITSHVGIGSGATISSADLLNLVETYSGTGGYDAINAQVTKSTATGEFYAIVANPTYTAAGNNDGANFIGFNSVPFYAAAGNMANSIGVYSQAVNMQTGSSGTIASGYGLFVANPGVTGGTGKITDNIGVFVSSMTRGIGSNVGVGIDAASTQTLWLDAHGTSTASSSGIAFASTRDVNLYRSLPGILTTDNALTVRGQGNNNGTIAVASISGQTSFATLVVENRSAFGDIFTASNSGVTQFVLTSGGALGLGLGNGGRPTAKLDVNGMASISSQLTFRNGVGSIQSSQNNSLTLGGSSTGSININPTSGTGRLNLNLASSNGLFINNTAGAGLTTGKACVSDIINGIVTGTTACSVSPDFWQYSASTGIIAPGNLTAATLFGSTASGSALLRIAGLANSGTVPVASIGARTSHAALVVDNWGVGELFVASSAGNTQFVIKNNGAVGIGTIVPTAKLDVAGAASVSGALKLYGTPTLQSTANQSLTLGGDTTGSININPTNGTGRLNLNLISTNGLFINNTAGAALTTGNACVSNIINGIVTGTTACGGGSLWQYNSTNAVVAPGNLYNATLFGSTASGSALLRIAGLAGSGIVPVASIGARTSYAAMVVDNWGVGDLFSASSSGIPQFTIRNNGAVGIGTTIPTAKLDVAGAASISGALKLYGIPTLQSTANQSLTLGGDTTGSININPTNGTGRLNLNLISTNGLFINNTAGAALTSGNTCISDIINGIVTGTTACGGGSLWQYNSTNAVIAPGNLQNATLFGSTASGSALLRIAGLAGSGTNPVASIGARTSHAALVVDNWGVGDIFAASSSGVTQMLISQNGALGLGLGNGVRPTAKLDVNGMASISSQLAFRTGAGEIQTTGRNSLTIGGSTTGDITFTPNTRIILTSGAIELGGSIGSGLCLTGGVSASWGSCGSGGSSPFQELDGAIVPLNSTEDLLIGGQSTASARFTFVASTGELKIAGASGTNGNCLISGGIQATVGWGSCVSGGGAVNWWQLNSALGTLTPGNQTLDVLFGGINGASSSARFVISGNAASGTTPVASVSANTSFAGFVVDNRGSGDIFTASSSGMSRFTIFQNGNVTIGNSANQGYKLDVQGSVRIGNNTTTSDIVKQTTSEFTVAGSSISTNNGTNTVSTSGNQLKLVTDIIGAGGTPAAPAADQNTGTNVTTGSVAFQRPDRKFIVYVGGATTSKIYDPTTGLWGNGPSTTAALGAGARALQRQNGSFLIVHGGAATTTTVYQPAASNNFGTVTAGPAATGNVGAGSQIIRRTDGKILIIHGNTSTTSSVHDPVAGASTTSLIGSFATGPATTGNVVAGSFVLPAQNGKWIVGLGGGTTTNVYNPSTPGVGGGGGFAAGPALTTGSPGAGTHVIQLPDGRFMVLIGGSGDTQIYDQISNTFSVGPTLATDTLGAGAHSFQRSDGKWIVVVGGNSKNLQLYDPTSGANGSFSQLTGASGLQGATNVGAGALSIQRPDGKYVVVHGNTTQLTTLYDAGWNTSGTWTSEDILNTKISTYSAMIWAANPQSANNNARLDADTISFEVKTGDTTVSLGNNPYFGIQDSGGLIKSYGNSQYAKIRVTFTTPIRSYPSGVTGIISQTNIWEGEGGLFYRRSFVQPTVSSVRIQNPLISYGDPTNGADPSFGRNFATSSALMEGVSTDNSNRLTLQTLRNSPTSTASAGIIIASASANLTGSAGAGSHTIERNSGKFMVIHGNSLTTTSIYDSDTNTFSAGPALPNAAGAGSHSFLLPDGRFFVVLGGGAVATGNRTAIFDPQTNLFSDGPRLYGNAGIGSNSFMRPDGFFVILNGGATNATNILDPFTMAITQGPVTTGTTPNVGAGALNIKRSDGRFLIILGNGNAVATATNVYDPASNSFAAGPALVGTAPNTGGNAIQLNTGRILLFKPAATSNWIDPTLNTVAAGPTTVTANGAGSFIIPRSDGKIFKANGGNVATTNIIDPQSGIGATSTSAPTLPCSINTGGHVFQRPSGEYVAICGGATANTVIIDAGWNLGGTYTSEQIQVPDLSGTSSIFWKNAGQGTITVKYRTAATQQALGVASWRDTQGSGSYITPSSGDQWIQVRFDLQGVLQDLPGAKTRVWNASDSGGNMVYYRAVQAPILQYWKLMNVQDPSVLTLTSGSSNVFRFSADGQAYTSENGAWNSGGADLAERYSSKETLQAGEVVSLDRLNAQHTKRSTTAYDQNAMGIVSTQPGFVAGAFTENSYPIALVGRVPVKVSTENGEIKAGDYLTSASIPGYAMKATVAGRVLGQAMEDMNMDATEDCPTYGAGSLTTTKCGTLTVFVNLTSYNGQSIDVAMSEGGFALPEKDLPAIAGMDFAEGTDARRQQEVLGFLKTQKDNGQQVLTDKLYATQEVISPQIVTDLLVAKKIKAESIEGLEIITGSIEKLNDQLASQSAGGSFVEKLTRLSDSQENLESQMASLSANLERIGALNLLSMVTGDPDASEAVIVNNFASYGTATLSEASVLGSLTVGSGSVLSIGAGSIDSLGQDLSIQGLRQGAISFLGGLITFDSDGKANFKEDVVFEKNVAVKGVLSATSVSVTDLKLGLGPVTVLTDTEVEATSAAGLVTLRKDTTQVKVNNPLVKESSFIFITPKTRTLQDLFLIEQLEGTEEEVGSFTVGVDEKAYEDIRFNYLIVN